MDYRLKFFEKDSMPKTKGNTCELLDKLGKLKNTNVALNGGKNKATATVLNSDNDKVLLLRRSKDEAQVTFVGNLSDTVQEVIVPEGKYLDYMTNEKVEFKSDPLSLKPWEYKILVD